MNENIIIDWNKNEWNQLLNILTNLSKFCIDIHIKNGNIRIPNDFNNTIFDIDLPKKNFSVILPLIKDTLPILKMFTPTSETDVCTTEIDDINFIIKDNTSVISYKKVSNTHIENNEYIEDEKYNKYLKFTKENLGSIDLSDNILTRLITTIENFNVKDITIKVDNKKFHLNLETLSYAKSSKFLTNTSINLPDGEYKISTTLFLYPWKNVKIEFFPLNKENDKYIAIANGISTTNEETKILAPFYLVK